MRHLRKHATDNAQLNPPQPLNPQSQQSTNLQIPNVGQSASPPTGGAIAQQQQVPPPQHLSMHAPPPPGTHPVLVPAPNGNVLASY